MPTAPAAPKIAMINTSDNVLELFQTFFEEWGHTVTTAHVRTFCTDAEDFPLIESINPDLLMWNLAAPSERNWHSFQTIEHSPMMQGRHCILTSANERRAKEIAGEETQVFDEMLGKSFDLDQLAEVVAKALTAPS